jgi:orotidine-5'-phosphate decarboxylase
MKRAVGEASDRVVLALHDLEHRHMLGILARDIGRQAHAVSVNTRLLTTRGMHATVQTFAHWGVHNLFIDESFGVQDHDMILDIAHRYPESVGYITVDGTIGVRAMRRLAEAKNRNASTRRVKLIATTDLPEIPEEDIRATFRQSVPELVDNLASQAQEAGLDGFYSSLRQAGCGPSDFFWVASGVRLKPIEDDDKFRTATLAEARDFSRQPDLYMLGSAVTRFYDHSDVLQAFESALDQIADLESTAVGE